MLKPKKVIVESKGLRHWLQMKLAQIEGVSMNLNFQMPSAYIWDLSRNVLGHDAVPMSSPYAEATLCWRIDAILGCKAFQEHPDADKVNRYWRGDAQAESSLKRYQLASKLASLFEQYLLFRPEWIAYWGHEASASSEDRREIGLPVQSEDERWQAHLWQLLAEQILPVDNVHPAMLQAKVLDCIDAKKQLLPEHIYLFGINSLPGPSLDFFHRLASHTHVHLFHLNPCVEYWGDIQSDKAKAKISTGQQWRAWLDSDDDRVNPLLANLGQQGKRFFDALQKTKHFEISAFDPVLTDPIQVIQDDTVLHRVQQDILSLQNRASDNSSNKANGTKQDDSIVISASHSPLREIQALHDYLLHRFNRHPDLTPRDVLVTCPDIEKYAPYVDAVFRRPWHNQNMDDSPRLPCSIADRVSLEEEPLIGAFLDLFSMPDSRFEVSGILDYLRLPAVQQKFGFAPADLDIIEWWLQEACIHWGADVANKTAMASLENATAMYTWQWGLQRLLLGFAQGDSETLIDGRVLLPHVEGQNAVLLGQLIHLLDRLRSHSRQLQSPRSAGGWQQYLKQLKNDLFQPVAEESDASRMIDDVIRQLVDATFLAGYDAEIDYTVIQSYLNHRFAVPDSGNAFMTGQITFCSMVPMRSIPFKIIAVLGLNDGDFPRQDNPVSFDLLKQASLRPGDRSRRADDRYLFLETIVSARQTLYLSYQGKDIQTNEERQPSLVLKELMHYLERGYGWPEHKSYILQQPLQPFSPACFIPPDASFDKQWCRLARPLEERNNRIKLAKMALPEEAVDIETLVRFYDDPLKWFGQNRLNLFLEQAETRIDDAEPFDLDKLVSHRIRTELLKSLMDEASPDEFLARLSLAGRLPDSSVATTEIDAMQTQVDTFYDVLCRAGEIETETVQMTVSGIRLTARIPYQPDKQRVVLYRAAKCKAKDEFRLWLMHLMANIHFANAHSPVTSLGVFFSPYGFDKVTCCTIQNTVDAASVTRPDQAKVDLPVNLNAKAELEKLVNQWLDIGSAEPVLWHSGLARGLTDMPLTKFFTKVTELLDSNVYFRWFFGSGYQPDEANLAELKSIYAPLYCRLQDPKNNKPKNRKQGDRN